MDQIYMILKMKFYKILYVTLKRLDLYCLVKQNKKQRLDFEMLKILKVILML